MEKLTDFLFNTKMGFVLWSVIGGLICMAIGIGFIILIYNLAVAYGLTVVLIGYTILDVIIWIAGSILNLKRYWDLFD